MWDQSIQSCNHAYAVPHCNRPGDEVTNEPDTSQNEIDDVNRPATSELPPHQSTDITTTSTSPGSETQSSTQRPTRPTRPPQTSVSYLPPATNPPSTTRATEATTVSSVETTSASSRPTSGSVSYLPPGSTPATTSTLPDSTSSAVSSPQDGKSECTGEGFFPNPDDCRKFYRCVQGQSGYQRYDFQCGPGTAWDQTLQTCNHIAQVASCSTDSNEIDQGPGTSDTISGSPVTTAPTTTAASQSTTTTPPSATPISTESTTDTDTPSTPSTSETVKTTTEVSSTTTAVTSASNQPPVSGRPEDIQKPESSSTESSSESSSEQSSSSESSDSSEQSSTESSDCTTRKPNNTIVCNNEGFYPHPSRCDKFYRCVDNGNGFNVYHFDCPPGTIFDPSISVCNYPESVYPARDCTGGGTASPTSSETPVESTSEPETPEQPSSSTESTTVQSTSQQTEGSAIASTESSTISPTEISEGSTTESTTTSETSTEPATESTTGTTEASTESSSSEAITDASTTSASSTESESSEAQEPPTTASAEESTTTEQSTTESQEPTSTESQEQSTTESQESQEQSTTESQEQSATTEPGTMTPCPIGNLTDEQITLVCPTGFRRHPKYCNLFYQCTNEGNMEIKVLVLRCPDNTIFDEKKIQCLPEEGSSQSCTGAKASGRFYRTLEDNALSPVSTPKSNNRPARLNDSADCPTSLFTFLGEGSIEQALPGRGALPLSPRLQQHLLQVPTRRSGHLAGLSLQMPREFCLLVSVQKMRTRDAFADVLASGVQEQARLERPVADTNRKL